eukprot:SAG31_NODE_7021_length_1814_cov_1.695627_2_plen_156_part_01
MVADTRDEGDTVNQQRESCLEGLVHLLVDDDVSIRSAAGSALIALRGSDTGWRQAVGLVTRLIIDSGLDDNSDATQRQVEWTQEVERAIELAGWLRMMVQPSAGTSLQSYDTVDVDVRVIRQLKLILGVVDVSDGDETVSKVAWTAQRSAAATLVT